VPDAKGNNASKERRPQAGGTDSWHPNHRRDHRREQKRVEVLMKRILSGLILSAALTGAAHAANLTLLNVSYDPSRN
jgi:hypothetical protein